MTKARELSDYTGLQGDLALKSPVASPVFTGNVGIGATSSTHILNVDSKEVDDAYTPTSFNDKSQIRIVAKNTENNYAGINFSHDGGTEGFLGFVRTTSTTDIADFVFQGYDGGVNAYKEYMRINHSGIVTKPNQPAFSVYRNSGAANSSLGANGVIVCNGEHFDTGGNHNTSTGRFTAPVAGKYMISSFHMSTNDATYDNKNYTVNVNGSIYKEVYGSSGDAVHHQFNWSGIIQLAANDYVTLNYQNFNIYGSHANYSTFSGHLIG